MTNAFFNHLFMILFAYYVEVRDFESVTSISEILILSRDFQKEKKDGSALLWHEVCF